jgi:aspartyl/asparaginyl beta-hydroxylase (cupin superfamily)
MGCGAATLSPLLTAITEDEADARLNQRRDDIEALIAKGDALARRTDNRAAASFYHSALGLARSSQPETSLVQRLAPMLAHAQTMATRLAADFRATIERALIGAPPRLIDAGEIMFGVKSANNAPSFMKPYPQQPTSFFFPDMPLTGFFDPARFAWAASVESLAKDILAEALPLLENGVGFRPYVETNKSRPQGDAHGLLDNPDWSTLSFWENGSAMAENCARCPSIARAMTDIIPLCHIGVRAPNVVLSLLRPGARIPPHTGMINTRLICHLPLIVPPRCGFRVGSETRSWEVGKLLIFDDTVEHEAWNDSDKDRLILIFDVWRPELTEDERLGICSLFDAIENYQGSLLIDQA